MSSIYKLSFDISTFAKQVWLRSKILRALIATLLVYVLKMDRTCSESIKEPSRQEITMRRTPVDSRF